MGLLCSLFHCTKILYFRKFGDIGNTVRLQYQQERYHLTEGWAELVTCHALPGPGCVEGLRGVSPAGSGCVLVAEMSSEGTLASGDYTQCMQGVWYLSGVGAGGRSRLVVYHVQDFGRELGVRNRCKFIMGKSGHGR